MQALHLLQLLLTFFGLAAAFTQVILAGLAMQNASRITVNVLSAIALVTQWVTDETEGRGAPQESSARRTPPSM